MLGGAQIIAFAGLIETTGFFQATSTTDGRGPREGQFSMKDSTETREPGNYGVGFPNFLGKVEDPEARKSKLAAELANGRLAMMVTWQVPMSCLCHFCVVLQVHRFRYESESIAMLCWVGKMM